MLHAVNNKAHVYYSHDREPFLEFMYFTPLYENDTKQMLNMPMETTDIQTKSIEFSISV